MFNKVVQAKMAIEALQAEVRELINAHDIDRISEVMEVVHLPAALNIALEAVNKTANNHVSAVNQGIERHSNG